jgi:hypothetical protein
MIGLWHCYCTKQQWIPMSRTAPTVAAPYCCGRPMRFAWTFIEAKRNGGD